MIEVHPRSWPSWVLHLFHLDGGRLTDGSRAWISLSRPAGGAGAAVALAAAAAGIGLIVWTYRRERSLPPRRKVAFAALRAATFLAVLLALLHPVLDVVAERDRRAVTIVLVDDSLSFGIPDRYPSDPAALEALGRALGVPADRAATLSRTQVAERILSDPAARFLPRLAEKNLVKVYAFSDRLSPLPAGEVAAEKGGPEPLSPPAVHVVARGPSTDLAGAVREAIEEQGAAPVAAVVAITDGRSTSGEDLSALARRLADARIPFHAIGVGDPAPVRNLRVLSALVPDRVFPGDPLAVDVRLDQKGLDGKKATIDLIDAGAGPGEGGEPVGTVEVPLDARGEATARFETTLKAPGRHRLIVKARPLDGEAFTEDNRKEAAVEVIERPTKVLLVAGEPSIEHRILKNLLRRDRRTEMSSWLQSADPDYPQEGKTVLRELPGTPKDLFGFDVVILEDVDPDHLPPGFAALLREFVEKQRGGLALLAGPRNGPALTRSPALEPLRAILPVEVDPDAVEEQAGRAPASERASRLEPTGDASSHPATRLSADPARNHEIWGEVPGIYWSFPVKRAKPLSTVLLEAEAGEAIARRPVIAWSLAGGGRTVFVGFDGTWRWRSTAEDVYDRFWMQLVRSLAEGRLLGDRRRLLVTDRDSYGLGSSVRVSALIEDEDYRPVKAPSAEVEVAGPGGEPRKFVLEKDPDREGWFRGTYTPESLGAYTFRIPGGMERTVSIEPPDLEYQDPSLDVGALRTLAETTGGSFSFAKDYASVPDRIPDRRTRSAAAQEPRPLWDNWLTVAAVVGLLAAEWTGRKWSRLP